MVLKPADSGGGGRGVSVVRDETELEWAYAFARKPARNGRVVVERFLEGVELTIEAISHRGDVHPLAISDKIKPPLRTRVASALTYPAALSEQAVAEVRAVTRAAVSSLGLTDGPSHVEMVLTDDGPVLLELGARGGGGHIFSTIVEAVTGVPMVRESARVLVGDEPDLRIRHERGCVYELFAPHSGVIREIVGIEEARAMAGVLDVGATRKPGDVLGASSIACSGRGTRLSAAPTARRPCAAPRRSRRPSASSSIPSPESSPRHMPEIAAHSSSIADALSIRYNNRVYELQAAGEDVIVLSLGEAFFDIPLHGFDDLPKPAIFHYSHSRGLPELRDKLACYYEAKYGVSVDPASEMIVTAGSKIAIHMALMAILDPGDEVLILEPAWVSYTEQVRLCHGVPITVPYDVAPTEIEPFLTRRTKAVVLNYPNNPRGQLLGEEKWARLHELAVRHDLFLVCDEAYSDFVSQDDRFVSAGLGDPAKHHTIICNSMSKNYGMSGWRVGYVIANEAVTGYVLKINQHLVTCPATILSHYLVHHFDDLLEVTKPQIAAVVEWRTEVQRHLDRMGLTYLPGSATFYLFVSIAGSSLGSDAFCTRLLDERHVCVVPGVGYGASCDGFVRVSVGTESPERTIRGLEAIRDLVEETAAPRAGAAHAAR